MGLHYGPTRWPGVIRFHKGTITAIGYKDQECYAEHPIQWWLGISWRGKWFLGLIRTLPVQDIRK